MEQRLILRGFASGALGGLLAFAFARILAEPVIQRAIDFESGRDAAGNAAGLPTVTHDHELVSRAVQGNPGLAVGVVLFGVAMGGLVAVAHSAFPADVLLRFRLCAIGIQTLLRGTIALAFSALAERLAAPPAARHERTANALAS